MLEWIPTSERAVAAVAGPLVALGYLVGSIPFAYLLSTRRLRRQLRWLDLGRAPARPIDGDDDPVAVPGVVLAAVLSALAAIAVTGLAWDVAEEATPGGPQFSGVGIFSNQALEAWVSVALWTSAAAVAGHMAPVWLRFRGGGTGAPPAVAVTLVHVPVVFVAGAAAFILAHAIAPRPRVALLAALPTVVVAEYAAWLWDVQWAWGATNGPEVALWTTVVAAGLFARNLRPRR